MTKLPSFSLPDHTGETRTNADFAGKWIIVYCYPKDDTPGCTTEACGFRDSFVTLTEKGVKVIGVSKDSVASHKKFAQKFDLPFTLLSDPELGFIKDLGAWGLKKFMGKEYEGILRNTYLVDPKGEIVRTFAGVTPAGHADELLAAIAELQG